jgi:Flp pilus assembly protein TadG
VLLTFLTLGIVEIALVLYGRNVVAAAAHEGARAAVTGQATDGEETARGVIERAVGGLVDNLQVDVSQINLGHGSKVVVQVRGTLRTRGPIGIPIPVSIVASSFVPPDPR